MAYDTAEARTQLLDMVGAAIDELGSAVAALGEAYELLDPASADQLEEQVFGPLQTAIGRGRKARAAFAARHGLQAPAVSAPAVPPRASLRGGAREFVDAAVTATARAEAQLVEVQDTGLATVVGDPELRAALGELRTLIGPVPGAARRLLSNLGR